MREATVPDPGWAALLADVQGLRVHHWDMSGPPPSAGVGFVVPPLGRNERLSRLGDVAGLRVVQVVTAGFDHVLAHLPDAVTLCNAAGVHDAATAEFAVTLILASQRGIPELVRAQDRGVWLPLQVAPSLADRRVLVVGYGRIGQALARRLAPFEVALTAVASTARPSSDGLVEWVHGMAELPQLLPRHDIVVLLTPLLPSTRGLVDAAFLAAMPDGALLVNISRGPVVDTDALVAETSSGRLRAALDVTDPEPLPPGHPLFHTPAVLLAPHRGGAADSFAPRMLALLRDQLGRYAADAPLLHVVRPGH